MKLSIMQPYFFPYLGYFDLIKKTDLFIIFDCVKYQRRTWMNRNRILSEGGWNYITAPVEKPRSEALISEVSLVNFEECERQLLLALQAYKPFSRHYNSVTSLVKRAFSDAADNRLVSLNTSSIASVCEYLEIPFNHEIQSAQQYEIPEITRAGDWALEISTVLGASEYINLSGGRDIFISEDWRKRGINLKFTELVDVRYETRGLRFHPHMSILDVLMWLSPAEICDLMDGLPNAKN